MGGGFFFRDSVGVCRRDRRGVNGRGYVSDEQSSGSESGTDTLGSLEDFIVRDSQVSSGRVSFFCMDF
jgi:hypothetical protein